ncbi:TIGR04255 family protein [Idiomarina sp.]|uniref:TIGR04255 family protein n=1 Tax=Idiomarina sp. TaxID=1874361 RepID=UPI0025C1DF18|nr:TIGR04255 family protein [Idiomarina sp.]
MIIPEKLKKDTIVEALFEVRFSSPSISEVVIGKLCDNPQWESFEQVRLAAADMPQKLRDSDPSLRYQPLIQLENRDVSTNVRIGGSVLSIHRLVPYSGWNNFKDYLTEALKYLERTIKELEYTRFGLRYVNLLSKSGHAINRIDDLNLNFTVGGGKVSDNFNFTFYNQLNAELASQVRITTPHYLSADRIPTDTLCAIDVDIFTPDDAVFLEQQPDVLSWLDRAHDNEKEIFFSLFDEDWLKKMSV